MKKFKKFNQQTHYSLDHFLLSVKITTEGDIILGGLFPVHKEGNKEDECGVFNEIPGYQYMEAMRYAVEKINNRSDLLPGIKLGTIIYDTCRSPTISADRTKDFIQLTLSPPPSGGGELAGIIGPFVSGNSKIVGSFLRVFQIPQISYASLSVELSNKDIYNYFFRTVPPDSFFAEALAELLERLGWNYASLIYSKGTYSETGAQEVIKALAKRKICLAKKHRLKRFPEPSDYDDAIAKVAEVKEANVVIFVTIQRDSRKLLMAKERYPLAKRLLIVGSIAWSNREDITKGLGPIADGTITFAHQEGNVEEFKTYFRSFNLSNYNANYQDWFRIFWQKQFNCSLNVSTNPLVQNFSTPCNGTENLHSAHMEIAPVRVVINAVNAMAYALHNMQQSRCPNSTGLCPAMRKSLRTVLQKFLKNVTFPDAAFNWPIQFDQNNEVEGNYSVLNFRPSDTVTNTGGQNIRVYRYDPVGKWAGKIAENGEISGTFNINLSDIRWVNKNGTRPSSICSLSCSTKRITVPRPGKTSACCWTCEKCNDQDIIKNNTCQTCVPGYVPNDNLSKCLKLTLKYVDMNSPLAVTLVFFSILGIIIDLVVFAVFFINRHKALLKAWCLEISYTMLVGIFIIFLVPVISLTKPTTGLCYFGRFLMGISYTICYAPLCMKIWRIYRMFKYSQQPRRMSGLIGQRSQLLITLGLIAVQILFFALITSTNPPDMIEKFYTDTGELHLECYLTSPVFVAYLSYNVVLMLLCTIYAFLARQFPKNFNEAMHISVTMCLTCVLWVVFLASFLNVSDSVARVYWICGASVVIGWINLLGLFAPKVYQVFTKKIVDDNALIIWETPTPKLSTSDTSEKLSSLPDKQKPITTAQDKLQLTIPKRIQNVEGNSRV